MDMNEIRQLALESFSLGLKEEFEIYLSGFKAGFKVASKLEKTPQNSTPKQVEINGLLWDTENLVVQGNTHFTYEEALKAAASVGKRPPTKEEYESLLALGWQWDDGKKGILVANQLFFPASGYRSNSDGKLYGSGTNGYGWTSTPSGSGAYGLYFYSGDAYVGYCSRNNGRSVRCVQDMETTQFPVTGESRR